MEGQPRKVGGIRLDDFIGRDAAIELAMECSSGEGNFEYRRPRRRGEDPTAVRLYEDTALTVGMLASIGEELGEEGAQQFMTENSLTHSIREKVARRRGAY